MPRSVKSGAGALPGPLQPRDRFTLGRAQQLVKTFADCRRQSSVDIGVKAFLMRTKRCARNALYSFDRRRFNRQFTAAGFQSFDHRRNLAAGFGSYVISKPFGQGIGVGNGGFSKAESNANLGTDALRRTACEKRFTIHRSRQFSCRLSAAIPCGSTSVLLPWKAASITEEGQQDREAEPRFAALGHYQGVIGRRQSPRIVGRADALRHAATQNRG